MNSDSQAQNSSSCRVKMIFLVAQKRDRFFLPLACIVVLFLHSKEAKQSMGLKI